MKDFSFQPSTLVLVRNSSVETDLVRCNSKPRYIGPIVIAHRTPNGSYQLTELDGTVSKLHYAAFCLVPYRARSYMSIPITRLVKHGDLVKMPLDEDTTADPESGTSLGHPRAATSPLSPHSLLPISLLSTCYL